jgi:hypothetical protein
MSAVTFDTLKFVKTLKASGIDDKQAEAISSAFTDAQNSTDVVTRADLKELELNLKQESKEQELRIVKWILGAIGLLFALLKMFPN